MIKLNFKSEKYLKYLFIMAISIISIASILLLFNSSSIGQVFSNDTGKETPIYSVNCSEKKAAITFDCAWGADDIPEILQALKKENVKATFFIVGQWAEKYPDSVRMIFLDGHDIANHSYSHLRMGALDRSMINNEIQLCSNELEGLIDGKIDLFRPPYGDYSNNVVEAARELGYYTIQWNVDSLDWKPGISRDEILERISVKINPGSIILFHNDTAHTAHMLPDIISAIKGMGYELIPVSELILRENYIIDFEGRQKKK
jgi:peptidoglycan-N-acetylglucosamine deacetylase